MGLNAYFAFQVCQLPARLLESASKTLQVVGVNGSGSVPYRTALTAIFIEGFIFIFLALTGMRQWLVKLIPATLKTATGVGIGFLLTEIGLSYSAGIGAITGGGISTPLTLAGCPAELLNPDTGLCTQGQMSNPKVTEARFSPAFCVAQSLTSFSYGLPSSVAVYLLPSSWHTVSSTLW